jgi:hypothetical protein
MHDWLKVMHARSIMIIIVINIWIASAPTVFLADLVLPIDVVCLYIPQVRD